MPKRLESCVRKVKAKTRKTGKKVNAWAVCVKSTGIKKKKGGGWSKGKKKRKK